MARITVAWEALERGQFPPICCRTGEPTGHYAKWRFTDALLRRYEGILPISPQAVRRVRVYARVALVATAIGVAGVTYGIASRHTGVIGGGIAVLLFAGIMLLAAALAAPGARREPARGAVELRHMHPNFVQTIEAAWAQQRSSG